MGEIFQYKGCSVVKFHFEDNFSNKLESIFDISINGEGTKENPFFLGGDIFRRAKHKTLTFSDSKYHVVLDHIKLSELILVDCHNVKMITCNIKYLEFKDCSNIYLDDCLIRRKIKIKKSDAFKIENSLLNNFGVVNVNDIIISYSLIKKINENSLSRITFYSTEIKKVVRPTEFVLDGKRYTML